MQNLLVTGGCGFIGANFIRYLLEETSFSGRVINLDKLSYASNPGLNEGFTDRYHFVHGDIADQECVDTVFQTYAIDSVCHLAAESHVDRSIADPRLFVESNILGTHCLLEAARVRLGTFKRFHHVSTDEVFGSIESGAFTEESPYDPSSPYAATKAASDHLVRAYVRTYDLPATLSNCSNNYGPYQFPEKLIPLMIQNLLEGKPAPIYGDGKHVRDWLYVGDHCRALWTIMQRGCLGETYLIGCHNEWENGQLVERLADLLDDEVGLLPSGRRRDLVRFVADRPGHDKRYAINATRIQEELGWRAEESADSGLRKTVRWYLKNQDWVDSVRSRDYREWISYQYGTEDRAACWQSAR